MTHQQKVSRLTNVLIFKEGFYYITVHPYDEFGRIIKLNIEAYEIVPNDWKLDNGFEFASDAYAYLVHLQTKEEKVKEI